ncbi:MAG: SusD/RagB family nutrient-binding outer membrane lipoprotein [Bacteroidales bacterium]|nr:SusD/RagB family nutrient-binding outer membrane lipoprotein [Bacteroidales bacterium]
MKKTIYILSTLLGLSLVSCNDWLDINVNPNAVTSVENGLVVPVIEQNLLNNYGLYGQLVGAYLSQQFSVKPGGPNTLAMAQWLTQDGASLASRADNIYFYSYIRVINNAKTVREQAQASGAWGDYLAATVYRAIAYQMLVDTFGETPYTEAENTGITAPHYDEGKDVYAGIITDLDEALSKVTGSELVCDNMLFLSSTDVNNYVRLANTIKLRILMRESRAVDVKSQLAALVAEDNFITADVKFASSLFTDQAGLDNPLYDQFVRGAGNINAKRTMDICGHMAVLGTMTEVNDPRAAAKFNASVKFNNYEGDFIDTQHSIEITAGYCDGDTYAEPVLAFNTPVYLVTLSEVDFFLAEYYSSIAPDAAKAKQYYEAAIDASFATEGVTGSDAIYASGAKYAWNASKADELIGIQKWVALANINGFESWCELRRLGYPAFNSKNGAAIYAKWSELAASNKASNKENPAPLVQDLVDAGVYTYGTILTPQSATEIADNTLVGRLLYSSTYSTNRNTNAPARKDKAEKVFWAK